MLLALTTTARPATDLGYLLHKNPARVWTFELSFGKAHVFYPEATEERCTIALLLDVDPVGLVRGRSGPAGEGGALDQSVHRGLRALLLARRLGGRPAPRPVPPARHRGQDPRGPRPRLDAALDAGIAAARAGGHVDADEFIKGLLACP